MKYEVKFFRTSRGDEPVKEYILNLSEQVRLNIYGCIHTLMTTGRLEMPHGKKLTGHKWLYEIRYGRQRVIYGVRGSLVVLLNAFMKKTQMTPKKELELAEKRFVQFLKYGG